MKTILQPFSEQRLGDILKAALNGQVQIWNSFQAAVAFAKRSGVQHIENELRSFVAKGGFVRMVVGIDQYGTSIEGLSVLLAAIGDQGEIWINHDSNNYITFHPKVYLFEEESLALLVIGSGNLTEGGLYTNDEASLIYELDLSNQSDQTLLQEVKQALNNWCDSNLDSVKRLNESLLRQLVEADYVRSEEKSRSEDEAEISTKQAEEGASTTITEKLSLFGRGLHRRRPTQLRKRPTKREEALGTNIFESNQPYGFVMTLMRTDVGSGQVTPGTQKRSPEIFVPLAARNMPPQFWEWPDAFTEDQTKPGKFDRFGVLMRIGGEVIKVSMMTWPDKHDFRLRSEALRSAGREGDILRIEKTKNTEDFAYYVEIVPTGTSTYEYYLALCDNKTSSSKRKWGYYP